MVAPRGEAPNWWESPVLMKSPSPMKSPFPMKSPRLDKILKPFKNCFGGNIDAFDYPESEDEYSSDYNIMEDEDHDFES